MKKPPKDYYSLFDVAHARIVPGLLASVRAHPRMLDSLFGLPEPQPSSVTAKPSANERYWLEWFYAFAEVEGSVGRLGQALAYLSHYPRSKVFRLHGLTEADWLRYHIEAHLQEVYILSQRLEAFLKRVERVATKAGDGPGAGTARSLRSQVRAALEGIVKSRGGHVHRRRFQDPGLRDLDTLMLLTRAGELRKLREFRAVKFDSVLSDWRKRMTDNNKAVSSLCASVFKETTEVLLRAEPPA
jgi:hypothetical protein